MFGFKKDKNVNLALVLEERENFLVVLTEIMDLLKYSGNSAQSDYIHRLIELFNQNNISYFVNQINGIDMWGGAGAVWEVCIEDTIKSKEFDNEMLKLISLMEKTKIIGNGIKPIKKIFEDNLKYY